MRTVRLCDIAGNFWLLSWVGVSLTVLFSGWAWVGSSSADPAVVVLQVRRTSHGQPPQDDPREGRTVRRPFVPLDLRAPTSNTSGPVTGSGLRPFGLPASSGSRLQSGGDESTSSLRQVDYWETDRLSGFEHDARYHGGSTMGFNDHGLPERWITGVDGCRVDPNREARWRDARPVPWESLGYGEYIGPPRTPHLPEYRALINDEIDFVFRRTRELSGEPYRFGIGDILTMTSDTLQEYNDTEQAVQLDGTIQVRSIGSVVAVNRTVKELQDEINQLAQTKGLALESPDVLIKPISTETRLQDLIKTVDATAGFGGQSRTVSVSPDGTVQLPGIGVVPALGLTLTELSAEANARYAREVKGLEVTAILRTQAPRFVFVAGEVVQPGQVTLNGPTTVIQAITQAGGWRSGANLRHVVVMRRDRNWQLVATKLDLSGALWGHRPHPSDDLWLRHSDIVLLPKNPGQRIADFVEVYFSRGLYGVFPTQGFAVSFDGVSRLQ